jgi:hypothetical protein
LDVFVSTLLHSHDPNWRTLYRAAILEPDLAKIPTRITEAEKEIVQRARELFQQSQNNLGEEQALDSAMCTLHVFRSTLKKKVRVLLRKDLRLLSRECRKIKAAASFRSAPW